MRRLTFELTPRAEAGAVSLVRDDSTTGADQACSARRSESGVERGVRQHLGYWPMLGRAAHVHLPCGARCLR